VMLEITLLHCDTSPSLAPVAACKNKHNTFYIKGTSVGSTKKNHCIIHCL
jgi:hypothetical protein